MKPPAGHVLIALHRGETLIGRLIRWQTRGEFSHASLIFPDGSHYEAREFKGVIRHASFEPKDSVALFAVAVTDSEIAWMRRYADGEIGAKYDYGAVLRFITRTHPTKESDARWFCSEFVFAVFQAAGIRLFERTEAWEVCPDLLKRSTLLMVDGPLAA